MDVEKTRAYYRDLASEEICDCAYCRHYVRSIRSACPALCKYLEQLGIDAGKPLETMPLDPYGGMIVYIGIQYVVMGKADGFQPALVDGSEVTLADSHPWTGIEQDHFVIEVSEVRLPWQQNENKPGDFPEKEIGSRE